MSRLVRHADSYKLTDNEGLRMGWKIREKLNEVSSEDLLNKLSNNQWTQSRRRNCLVKI